MSYDILVKMFGSPSDVRSFHDLAEAVENDRMRINFEDVVDADGFASTFEDAVRQGRHVELTVRSGELADEVRNACQAAGVAYVLWSGPSGQNDYTQGISWRPGMKAEFEYGLIDDKPSIPVSEMRKVARKGIEAVNEFLDDAAAANRLGRAELAEGFMDAYRVHVEDIDGHEATGAPAP